LASSGPGSPWQRRCCTGCSATSPLAGVGVAGAPGGGISRIFGNGVGVGPTTTVVSSVICTNPGGGATMVGGAGICPAGAITISVAMNW
jgi:hypothetical protein